VGFPCGHDGGGSRDREHDAAVVGGRVAGSLTVTICAQRILSMLVLDVRRTSTWFPSPGTAETRAKVSPSRDHEQRSPFGLVSLAVDEPKGDLAQGENGRNSPNTDTSGRTPTDT
jgi:hypothetical protein